MTEKRSQLFAQKVEAAPDNLLHRFSLAQALVDEGDHAAAIPHLRQAIAGRNDWMLARILLGKSLLQVGETAAARKELQAALDLALAQNHEGPATELTELLDDIS